MQKNPKRKLRKVVCKCCGGEVKEHPHTLSKGIVTSLIKMKHKIREKNQNKIHLIQDLGLSNYEYNNFQKLRYFGLVAKVKDPITKNNEKGYYLLTRNGNRFLLGQLDIPKKVYTMSNKISGKAIEKIFLSNVLSSKEIPYWDDYTTPVENEISFFPSIYDMEEEEIVYDENGQTQFFF